MSAVERLTVIDPQGSYAIHVRQARRPRPGTIVAGSLAPDVTKELYLITRLPDGR